MRRDVRRAAVLWGIALLASALTAPASVEGRAASNNPCDTVALPICVSALGPLVDVTNSWQSYQPALSQPIPISDYLGDPEDNPPKGVPPGVGTCGGETTHPPPPIPVSTEVNSLPTFAPGAPPGNNYPYPASHYCLLRYIDTDFDQLCSGCRRVLVDYSAIPAGNGISPGSNGHWAARFNAGSDFTPTIPFRAHSPNIKNLCADKFFNEAPGSGCTTPIDQFDLHALEMEGDSTIFHHFPTEGRYYNGPSYLAGDGVAMPFHWVHGAYFDLDLGGAAGLPIWYSVGYRGIGDLAADTDQSYGCLCEIPPVGHTAFSPTYQVGAATPSPSPAAVDLGGGGGSPGAALPNTSGWPPAWILAVAGLSALAAIVLTFGRRIPNR
ncbi:MAG: hypothetical protein M3O87_00935 [Candidatus Dormibacteraeota bacterium]|nr:hypothetical protein [Candidatus Dormibacteraeota bacterium]